MSLYLVYLNLGVLTVYPMYRMCFFLGLSLSFLGSTDGRGYWLKARVDSFLSG